MDSRKFQDVDFIAALALHSYRRDQALYQPGYISTRTRGLLWFYNTQRRQQVQGFFKAAFDHGAAQAAKKRMGEIVTEAELATPERQLELLAEAQRLQERLSKIMEQGPVQ